MIHDLGIVLGCLFLTVLKTASEALSPRNAPI